MTYARRVDANHSEIVRTLKELGCSVFDSSRMAGGFPDLVVGINKITCLVEIKSSDKAKYTPAQEAFMLNWKGSTVARIDSVDAAIRLVNILKKG
jgi:Holliday junction resolvase